MTLRDRVIAYLLESDGIEGEVGADTSLIRSGMLDSLALFNLSLWIEKESGGAIDLADVEIAEAWDTPAAIAEFIEQCRTAR